MAANADSMKVVVAAMIGNGLIAVSKFTAGILTGSVATIAEAVHSVADTTNQALLIVGFKRSKKAASDLHQFGHGAEAYFWPFIVSVMIFLLGGAFAMYEGFHSLFDHTHREGDVSNLWNYVVLGVATVLEMYSFSVAYREFRKMKGTASTMEVIVHSKDPTIPVVLMEDTAALLGLFIALVAVALSDITGWAACDAIGSILIGVLLCVVSYILSKETHSLLIGESATKEDRKQMIDIAQGDEAVVKVTQVLSLHRGPEDVLVALKIAFHRSRNLEQVEAAIDRVEDAIRKALPRMRHIFIEPDARYDAAKDEARAKQALD
jgi:cation diffusion facilitator family transporter